MTRERSVVTEVDTAPEGAPRSLPRPQARTFRLEVVEGPSAGLARAFDSGKASLGSHESNDLVLDDRKVSRFHCEVAVRDAAVWVRDLGSRNGTVLDGVVVESARLREGSLLKVGASVVRFQMADDRRPLPVSESDRFGGLVASSIPMRAAFFLLERAAESDTTVLIEGETGTGKDVAAESLHAAGRRAGGPFVVVDCAGVPATLIESELFGHEKGAFTGATARRIGAFETAAGGTIFLDEIGELPPDVQPKLLRVLEQRTIQRVGSSERIAVDVRVIAATNRDLRSEVNEGAFRSDLYYRLAVVKVRMPPLRERPEDIPAVVARVLDHLGASADARSAVLSAEVLGRIARAAWPGNVRELRNYVEQFLVLRREPPLEGAPPAEPADDDPDAHLSYDSARERALERFERRYLSELLERYDNNVSKAAREAGMDRAYLHRLLRRHRLRGT